VGYYSVASQIADTLSALPQAIALVLFPKLVASQADRFKTTMQNTVRTAGLMALVCGTMWLIADPAIRFAFGPGFAPAVSVLHAMLPGVLLLGVMAIVSQYLAASGFPIAVVVTWLLGMGLSAGLGRTLIAHYGAVGAGLTLSITYAVLLVVLAALCWRMARRSALASE
jgi:O-antigen/teichoic acid export membrane protein